MQDSGCIRQPAKEGDQGDKKLVVKIPLRRTIPEFKEVQEPVQSHAIFLKKLPADWESNVMTQPSEA
jgi:hypothetical protein